MTTQAQQLADARKATEVAQALADQREQVVIAQRAELDELQAARRALCDLLSKDASTIAGQTLVEAVQTIITERDAARAQLTVYRRQYGALHRAARAVVESGKANELWMGIDPAAMEELARCVSSTTNEQGLTPLEDTRGGDVL